MESRIKALKSLLDRYDDAYYNNDESLVSDSEYDALKQEYLSLTGQEEYNYVPGEALFNKVEHTYPVKSLDKINISEQDKLKAKIEELWPVVIQTKLDGLTEVTYPDGKKVTRGNGIIGEDITKNCDKVLGIGHPLELPVRSECVIFKSTLIELNKDREKEGKKPFDNTRNAAAGTLRNKDNNNVKGVVSIAYNILGSEDTEIEQLKILKDAGYNTVDYYVPDTIDDAIDFINNFDRNLLDYDIDGLVIKSNKPNAIKKFGETGHHYKNAIAVKFVSQGEWTTLRDVVWTVGKEKVVPNAIFDPVDVMGSTISRATLHNMAYINALGLRINEPIKVIKANDVIPAVVGHKQLITRNTFPIIEPTTCPCCGSNLEKVYDRLNIKYQLFCRNDECRGKLATKTVQMANRDALNIEGLSEETVDKMLELYGDKIKQPWDCLELELSEISALPGFASKSSENLFKNMIKATNKVNLDKFIYACCIPLIGRRAATDIALYFKTLDNLILKINELENVEGIGEERVNSVKKNIGKLIEFSKHVNIERMKDVTPKLEGALTFVITGTLSKPRKELENAIKGAGHKVSGSVSAKTSYVVTNDTESTSSKFVKAKELGIKIINEDELEALLNG